MPTAAQQTLLRQVGHRGARLLYHGDFDWAGLRIGNFVVREFNASPWRFPAADYEAARSAIGPPLSAIEHVEALWDSQLQLPWQRMQELFMRRRSSRP
jgi:uncharacterized protein (TIGR02679 family)